MPGPTKLPFRAVVTADGSPVATSEDTVRVDPDGEVPQLWFPVVDVTDPDSDLWQPGSGELTGFLLPDPERAVIEVVDPCGSDDPRDTTHKRFPTWGDATELVEFLDVEPAGDRTFTAYAKADHRRPVVEGSQLLAQTLVAVGRTYGGRRPVSASMTFTRAADARRPVTIALDEASNGRTFSAAMVKVTQGDKVCAIGVVLADSTAPDLIRHQDERPVTAGPYDAVPFDMGITGRDLRVVDAAYDGNPDAPVGPPVIDAWVRFAPLGEDPVLHAALMAQFTGHMSIGAALRPHAGYGEAQAHRTLSTAVNTISLSVHAPVRADRWMLYRHRSTFAGDGMTRSSCTVHDEDGLLLASFSVDGMVRGFADPAAPVDFKSTM